MEGLNLQLPEPPIEQGREFFEPVPRHSPVKKKGKFKKFFQETNAKLKLKAQAFKNSQNYKSFKEKSRNFMTSLSRKFKKKPTTEQTPE